MELRLKTERLTLSVDTNDVTVADKKETHVVASLDGTFDPAQFDGALSGLGRLMGPLSMQFMHNPGSESPKASISEMQELFAQACDMGSELGLSRDMVLSVFSTVIAAYVDEKPPTPPQSSNSEPAAPTP